MQVSEKSAAMTAAEIFKKFVFGMGLVFGGLLIILFIAAAGMKQENNPAPAEKAATTCAATDLQCLGDIGELQAGAICRHAIESQILAKFEWQGGFGFAPHFYKWFDQSKGQIAYVGDDLLVSNIYGAMLKVHYFCAVSADNQSVVASGLEDGPLPQ